MKVVCGIDEAGYGPPLGPLVVSTAIFEAQDAMGDGVQEALAAATAATSRRARGRPVVCDSKRLCAGPRSVARLERNLLPFVEVAGGASLIFAEATAPAVKTSAYPWYAEEGVVIPVSGDGATIVEKAARLREALAERGVRFVGFRYEALHPTAFNAAVHRTGNKADVLLEVVGRLLRHIGERAEEALVEVWADKLGGRDRYAPFLAEVFPGAWIAPLVEGPLESAYVVARGGQPMTVRFCPRAESRHRAVALASMCSKYVRELYMLRFNAFWGRRIPGLAPTKGYAQDAARFLRQIEDVRAREGVAPDLLVRCR